jgi:lysozyme family protein
LGAINSKRADTVANATIDQRQRFYETLAEKRPTLKKFLKGWTNRNNNLRKFIA